MQRSSGIIMHIASLPNEYGIGTFGKSAYQFADFLKGAGQKYWQLLPLGHASYGDSPYQSFSAFAGNPYFIDFKLLAKDGLLEAKDYESFACQDNTLEIDYGRLFRTRYKVLRKAYDKSKRILGDELVNFVKEKKLWIEDYALYMAIKYKNDLKSWQEWPYELKTREKKALDKVREDLKEETEFWIFVQYQFFKQWTELKDYVNRLGIEIIGDIPIYIAEDSADAWSNPKIFKLDENKIPTVVAGCPPDAFSETGQLWGNPIYRWDYLEETGYKWWIERIKESLKLYDMIRIDHFRGFEAYWEVPYGETTAMNGRWAKGPGIKLFKAIKEALGDVNIIAEDLGYLTQEVIDFRNETGYPGMKVLQFAFDTREESEYIPHTYYRNCIVYTGTHDNDTILGWMHTTGKKEDVAHAIDYLHLTQEEGYHWGFIRGAWSSVGAIAITQMQDILGLGNEARMNFPSTVGFNWNWRMKEDALDKALIDKVYQMTRLYGRCKERE